MKHILGFRTVGRLAVPLALLALTGCAAIEAQKIAGEGNRLVEKDQLDQAVEKFQASIGRSDNDVAHAGMAEAMLRQGKYAEAEKEATTAIKMINETWPAPRYKLVLSRALLLQNQGPKAYDVASDVVHELANSMSDPASKATAKDALLLQIRIIEATGAPADALKLINDPNIQARWPDDLDFRSERAIVSALTRDYDKAAELADAVLKLKAKDGDAKLARGMALAASGKTAEAKEILEPALREDHTRVMVLLSVTRALRQEKKNQEAIDLLTMLSEIQPQNYVVHSELAFIYMDMDKFEASVKEHELTLQTYPALKPYTSAASAEEMAKALEATPPAEYDRKNLGGYYENLSYLHGRLNDTDKSIAALERAAVVAPTMAMYQNLASAYDRKGDTASAIATMEKALKMEPENTNVMKALGALEFKAGHGDKAREYLKKAAAGKGDDAEAHLNLGVVLYNSKQYKDALAEFQQAVQLKPDNVDALFYLGVTQLNSGDDKGATETLKKVVELKSDHADAYRELGNLAMKRKDYKAAEKYYALEDKYKGKTPATGKKK